MKRPSLMIVLDDVGKCFRLYQNPVHRVLDWMRLPGTWHRDFWSIRNVYLSIPQGTTFGVIGANGAGKSTLLRMLSGISQPSEGRISIQGSVASILEMGTGFHPEFTGRSNVYLNCALQGYTRQETDERMDEIIRFAELESFIDQPVRTYSTGMALRLAFAVATNVDPDVLVIDEALSVGDEHFRTKCVERLNRFRQQGKTIVLVSHDLATVRHFCTRIALLDQGRVVSEGAPDEVLDQYLEMVNRNAPRSESRGEVSGSRQGSGEVRFRDVRLIQQGEPRTFLDTGVSTTIEFTYDVNEPIEDVVFGFLLHRSDGTQIHGSNHYWSPSGRTLSFPRTGQSGTVRCQVDAWPLLAGSYYLTLCCYHQLDAFPQAIDHWEKALPFRVNERDASQHGILALNTEWQLDG